MEEGFKLVLPSQSDHTFVLSSNDGEQHELVSKMRNSAVHRRVRRKDIFENILKSVQGEKELRQAVCANDHAKVEKLVREGVLVNKPDDRMRTALHFAASKGYDNIVRVLLSAGANPNQQDCNGNTPLHIAVCTNHLPVVTTLLKAGTNVKMVDNFGQSPLQLALSRLRMLKKDASKSAESLKTDITEVIAMIRAYLSCSGKSEEVDKLHTLSTELNGCSTVTQLDKVNDMLAAFTSLAISAPPPPETHSPIFTPTT